jgi:hypothetical protein
MLVECRSEVARWFESLLKEGQIYPLLLLTVRCMQALRRRLCERSEKLASEERVL